MKKIVILMGGTSHEREVSLDSGRNIASALTQLGKYEICPIDLSTESLDVLPADVDAAYIALHGGWGENGGVQAALDALKIPYTGPGAQASRCAMDKIETKKKLDEAKIPTAPWAVAKSRLGEDLPKDEIFYTSPFGYPVVVKVPRDGSSVGVFLAHNDEEYSQAIQKCLELDDGAEREALIEKYIPGREMTVGILDDGPLPVIEIVTQDGWYGFEEKYHSNETKYPFLSDSSDDNDKALEKHLQKLAQETFRAIGCRGVTRIDFRVSPEGEAFVLELNTSPGFTSHSLVPKAGMKTGLSFSQVCDKILNFATHD